jgi:hypothetical protein
MRQASERQIKYVNILLIKLLGEEWRKDYLSHFYKVSSSKDLNFDQAHEIIEKFNPDNEKCNQNASIVLEKLSEIKGQGKLF